MISQIKAELKKLLTVRSTYILVIIALALTVLFNYFGTSPIMNSEQIGGKMIEQTEADGTIVSYPDPNDPPEFRTVIDHNLPKEKLLYNLQETVPLVVTFVTLALVLLVAHEFRYNTIMYTLTISRSRSKVLLAKVIVGSIFTIAVTLLGVAVALAATYTAMAVKDLHLPAQDYDWAYVMVRHLTSALGYALLGMGIAFLARNLTASIAAVFVLPTLDTIGGALLATRDIEPTKVLPFSALDRFGAVASDLTSSGQMMQPFTSDPSKVATATGALIVFLVYFAALWAVSWYLFLKRDAN